MTQGEAALCLCVAVVNEDTNCPLTLRGVPLHNMKNPSHKALIMKGWVEIGQTVMKSRIAPPIRFHGSLSMSFADNAGQKWSGQYDTTRFYSEKKLMHTIN